MLRGILVGLDGSAFSDAAVELSIRWAKQFDAELVGCGILDAPTIRKPTGLYVASGHKAEADVLHLAEAQAKVQQFLAQFARRCEQAGVEGRCVQDVGTPAEQLLKEAQSLDLIVLGKQTYFRFETQEGPDNVLFEVLQNATRPVVTVPDELTTSGNAIVIAYDGSVQVARTLHAFVPTGLWKEHDLHVVSVNKDGKLAERHARLAIEYLKLHQITATSHVVENARSVSGALLDKMSEFDAAMLVMGAYGRAKLSDFVFGSVTQRMLKSTSAPIFLYH